MTDNISSKHPEVIPFLEPIKVSRVTKDKGPLTKVMRLDPGTKELVKDSTNCWMASGTIDQVSILSPAGFAKFLRSVDRNQAMVAGTSQHSKAKIVTKKQLKKTKPQNGQNLISRTKDCIKASDGPGIILFDLDKSRPGSIGSEAALKAYSPQKLIDIIAQFHPEIAKAARVSTPSTSACIYDAEDNELRGEGTGSHIYLFVEKATDIPRYLSVVGKHLFLDGLGRIEFSRAGSLLQRTLVDLVVGSPERLDFIAGAVCEDGLIQKLPEPVVHNGEMLDTSTLPDLTPEQAVSYEATVNSLLEEAKPSQTKVLSQYIKQESTKLAAARNISIDEARQVVVSRQDRVLADDDLLYFSHLTRGITVAEVLKEGTAFHSKPLADPMEPEYDGGSKTKAIFYWNDGTPTIHSYAHGSIKYTFKQVKNEKVVWSDEDLDDFLERVKNDCGAPFESESIKKLAHMKHNEKPRFMQVRDKIKRSNNSVIITELDRDIGLFFKGGDFKSSPPPSPSLSSSYPSCESSSSDKVLHFRNTLITTDEKGKLKLVIESIAADLIAEVLHGQFAFDCTGGRWLRYTGNQWKACQQKEFDTTITELLYAGSGELGFRNSYETGIAALLQKSGRNRLVTQPVGTIPFLNGLLDMAKMKLQPMTPDNATTWVLPFNYTEEAQCPNFLDWLYIAVNKDNETILLIQAWLNALLTGRPDLQVFLHLIGPGGTGKSTFGRLVFILVGAANATTTSLKQLETNRFEAANIFGKRLVAIEEADKYGGSVSVLKSMTGQDPLRLERKNQQQQGSFIFEGQTLMMSNERLATTDYTSGIERRRITVEFTHRITQEERAAFEQRGGETALLYPEAPGIVNWALKLSPDEVTSTFKKMPERVRKANLAAARFNNPIVDWMLQNLIPAPQARTKVGTKKEYRSPLGEILFKNQDQWLYPNYLTWCQRSGREKVSLQRFSGAVADAASTYGVQTVKARESQGVKIHGLRIRGEHEDSWLNAIENEGQMKADMKSKPLNMFEMNTVKTSSSHPYTEKGVSPSNIGEDANAVYI